ncbi:hypothetical protein [Moorena sp. SIO4G3]|nr:hypothetical protein [Moorena sp. SIO4G3]NEO82253.1 hypothetical protein [Moorena sp. SIO4G3]
MGGTTPVAHGGNPQDRTGSPRPRCIALYLMGNRIAILSKKVIRVC